MASRLKLYVIDYGWAGAVGVFAYNETEARVIHASYNGHAEDHDVVCVKIKHGTTFETAGDS